MKYLKQAYSMVARLRLSEFFNGFYKAAVTLFAIIGLFTCLNWVHRNFIYGHHKNGYPEDILVVSEKSDTVVYYSKVDPGKLHLDIVTGELNVQKENSEFFHNLPANCVITWTDYREDFPNGQSTVFYFGEKMKR